MKRFLRRLDEGVLHYRQHGAAEDEIDFDLDASAVAFDEQFDVATALRVRQRSGMAQPRDHGLDGVQVRADSLQRSLAIERVLGCSPNSDPVTASD